MLFISLLIIISIFTIYFYKTEIKPKYLKCDFKTSTVISSYGIQNLTNLSTSSYFIINNFRKEIYFTNPTKKANVKVYNMNQLLFYDTSEILDREVKINRITREIKVTQNIKIKPIKSISTITGVCSVISNKTRL